MRGAGAHQVHSEGPGAPRLRIHLEPCHRLQGGPQVHHPLPPTHLLLHLHYHLPPPPLLLLPHVDLKLLHSPRVQSHPDEPMVVGVGHQERPAVPGHGQAPRLPQAPRHRPRHTHLPPRLHRLYLVVVGIGHVDGAVLPHTDAEGVLQLGLPPLAVHITVGEEVGGVEPAAHQPHHGAVSPAHPADSAGLAVRHQQPVRRHRHARGLGEASLQGVGAVPVELLATAGHPDHGAGRVGGALPPGEGRDAVEPELVGAGHGHHQPPALPHLHQRQVPGRGDGLLAPPPPALPVHALRPRAGHSLHQARPQVHPAQQVVACVRHPQHRAPLHHLRRHSLRTPELSSGQGTILPPRLPAPHHLLHLPTLPHHQQAVVPRVTDYHHPLPHRHLARVAQQPPSHLALRHHVRAAPSQPPLLGVVLHRHPHHLLHGPAVPLPHGDVEGGAGRGEEELGGPAGDAEPPPEQRAAVTAHRVPDPVPPHRVPHLGR